MNLSVALLNQFADSYDIFAMETCESMQLSSAASLIKDTANMIHVVSSHLSCITEIF